MVLLQDLGHGVFTQDGAIVGVRGQMHWFPRAVRREHAAFLVAPLPAMVRTPLGRRRHPFDALARPKFRGATTRPVVFTNHAHLVVAHERAIVGVGQVHWLAIAVRGQLTLVRAATCN